MREVSLVFIRFPAPHRHRHKATADPPRSENPADTTPRQEGNPAPARTGAHYARHERSHPGRAHLRFDPRTEFPLAPAPAAVQSEPDTAHPATCAPPRSRASDTASVAPRR